MRSNLVRFIVWSQNEKEFRHPMTQQDLFQHILTEEPVQRNNQPFERETAATRNLVATRV